MSSDHSTLLRSPSDIGHMVKARRRALGLSQESLASITGIPQPNLSKIERGQVAATLETTLRLLESLGIELHARVRA